MAVPENPITRKEHFLAKAAGESVNTPEPITREEMYLDAIASGSGGGGSALPSVTSADNGKVLGVVDGAWAADDKRFVVTYSGNGSAGDFTSNKTFSEIKEAYLNGKNIVGFLDSASTYVNANYAVSNGELVAVAFNVVGQIRGAWALAAWNHSYTDNLNYTIYPLGS